MLRSPSDHTRRETFFGTTHRRLIFFPYTLHTILSRQAQLRQGVAVAEVYLVRQVRRPCAWNQA